MSSAPRHDRPSIYPGIRHADSGLMQRPEARIENAPRAVMRGIFMVVAFAAAGYLAFATPTVADKPAAEAKAEAQAEGEQQAAAAPQAMPISAAVVEAIEITKYNEFSGRLTAAEDVEVRPRVSGIIDAVHQIDPAGELQPGHAPEMILLSENFDDVRWRQGRMPVGHRER